MQTVRQQIPHARVLGQLIIGIYVCWQAFWVAKFLSYLPRIL